MTGIEGVGWPAAPRITGRAPAKPGFNVPAERGEPSAASAVGGAQPASLASMLTLQEMGGETVRDREARRHAQDMLADLAELQRALLRGDGDAPALQRLAELAAAVPHATDRRLAAMISAVVVRVRVELARRQI